MLREAPAAGEWLLVPIVIGGGSDEQHGEECPAMPSTAGWALISATCLPQDYGTAWLVILGLVVSQVLIRKGLMSRKLGVWAERRV